MIRLIIVLAIQWLVVQVAQANTLLIEDITVIDGTGAAPLTHQSVLLKDGKIAKISPQAIPVNKATERINGQGKYLLPGLFDVHIHLTGSVKLSKEGISKADKKPDFAAGRRALHGYLYSGVTSVYDAGNDPAYIFKLRQQERQGKLDSPRIFATGAIVTYPGSHGSGFADIQHWPEAISVLDKHIAQQPDMLKLTLEERGWGARPMVPKLPLDLLQKTINYYNERGIRTTIHTSSELRARQAIQAGVDTLAHPVIQGPISEQFAMLMGTKKIPMASTLTIGENYSRLVEHPDYLDQPLYKAVLSKAQRHTLKTEKAVEYKGLKWTWWMKIMTSVAQENLAKIHKAGGVIALGTDQSLGPAVHRELELLSAAGISNRDLIRIATLNSALFLGKEKELGSIEQGKLADLIIVSGNPLKDIKQLKRINVVIKNGRVIKLSELDLPINQAN